LENYEKIGVYVWENKLNNKIYVGSGDPLYSRIADYYQPWYLKSRNSLYIVRSLNKHTMSNFNLHILEYSDSENVIMCEQKWIDLIQPEYNLSPIAGSSKGYKHSFETIKKNKNISYWKKAYWWSKRSDE
jgi:group I intron endonuclease